MRIEVAVTTAPRQRETLGACLESLRAAGFAPPTVYAEPGSDLLNVPDNVPVIQRAFRYGAWRNWIYAALEMVRRECECVLMVQDDTIFSPGAAAVLCRDLWPDPQTGYIQVAVSSGYRRYARTKGIVEVSPRTVMGAWAVAFPRDVLASIVELGFEHGWRGLHAQKIEASPEKKKAIDPFIGEACRALKRKAFIYNPSLAQHVARGENSTLGHDRVSGWRLAIRSGLNYQPGRDVSELVPSGTPQQAEAPPALEPDVSVVIPIAGDCDDLIESCLESVFLYGDYVNQILIVDNGTPSSGAHARKVLREMMLSHQLIRNENNLGFTQAANQGIAASGTDHVLLLNSDCRLGKGCLRKLRESLQCGVAAIGPLTFDNGLQSIKRPIRKAQAHLNQLPSPPLDLEEMGDAVSGIITDEKVLAFFCTLLNRRAIENVGTLDPAYESGLMADNEWCERVRKSGWKVQVHGSAFADHDHSQTFTRLRLDRKQLHKEAIRHHAAVSRSD